MHKPLSQPLRSPLSAFRSPAIAAILCGGLGERFWPLTSGLPKYALKFHLSKTFLEITYDRLKKIYPPGNIYIVTAAEHKALVRRILPGVPTARILAEPERRNTAAAVTYATFVIGKSHGDNAVISFFPADAMIRPVSRFVRVVRRAQDEALSRSRITVIGVRPDHPATGYGYIESVGKGSAARDVRRFFEKPDLKHARRFLKQGNFLWNAGIFTWKAAVFKSEMRRHAAGFLKNFETAFHSKNPSAAAVRKAFHISPSAPIDRLLIEKIKKLRVIPADFEWDDIGTWNSLRRLGTDRNGNILAAAGVFEDVKNCVILRPRGQTIVSGVENLVIAEKDGNLLITNLSNSQEVARLKKMIRHP